MAGRAGAAVALEVASGKVLAQYHMKIAAGSLAAPGSTVKPFTLLTLLRSGKLDPKQPFLCHRTLRIAGHRMDCTHPELSAAFDAAEALAYSCNLYFAAAALRLTDMDLRQEFQRAGLLSRTGLASASLEADGKMRRTNSVEQLQLEALGVEGIEVTPLALLNAYRKLALQKKNNRDPLLAVVFQGLENSTAEGMARAAQPQDFAVAGKTGTAARPDSPLTHGWFAGYAPADDPKIVLVVYLERGRGMDAAAIAQEIFTAYHQGMRKH